MPLLVLETTLTETEILDYWYAYLETRGIKVKSHIVEAKEAGFTDRDLKTIKEQMDKI